MSDTNKNGKVDPDEASRIVGEEKVVNEALVNKEITEEEAGRVTSLDALEKEAQKIEMEEGMGVASEVASITAEDSLDTLVKDTEDKKEEQPVQAQASTPPEVTAEIAKEVAREPTQESVKELDDLTSEFKKPLA